MVVSIKWWYIRKYNGIAGDCKYKSNLSNLTNKLDRLNHFLKKFKASNFINIIGDRGFLNPPNSSWGLCTGYKAGDRQNRGWSALLHSTRRSPQEPGYYE